MIEPNSTEVPLQVEQASKPKSRKLRRIAIGLLLSFLVTLCADARKEIISGRSFPTIEEIAYSIPYFAVVTAISPSFIPCLSYSEMFYQARRATIPYGQDLAPGVASSASFEGVIWGGLQGIVFYIPFFFRPRYAKTNEEG